MARNEDVEHNIAFIQTHHISQKIEDKRWWGWRAMAYIVFLLSFRTWIIMALCVYLAIGLCVVIHFRMHKTWCVRWICYGSVCFLFVAIGGLTRYVHDYHIMRGVMIWDNSLVKSAPIEEEESLFTLNSGVVVRVLNITEDWVHMRLSNGLEGWVSRDAMEIV